MSQPIRPSNSIPYYYAQPFSNNDQKIKQIALYIIAGLAIASALTLMGLGIGGVVCTTMSAVSAPVLAVIAAVLLYIGLSTPFFNVLKGEIVQGSFNGFFEKNFLVGMNYAKLKPVTEEDLGNRSDHPFLPTARARYDQFITDLASPAPALPQIPKKIHMIWIGPQSAPEGVEEVKRGWEKMQPGWEVNLWGNSESASLIAEIGQRFSQVQAAWDKAVKWAEKADILRYCILYKEGGFYADADLPALSKLDELHYYSDFYCGFQEVTDPALDRLIPSIVCNNAAIGAKAGHPILKAMLENLTPHIEGEASEEILWRTGPMLLTKCVRESQDQPLVLPPIYFYPMPMQRSPLFLTDFGYRSLEESIPYVSLVSKGMHLWAGSWVNFSKADVKKALARLRQSL